MNGILNLIQSPSISERGFVSLPVLCERLLFCQNRHGIPYDAAALPCIAHGRDSAVLSYPDGESHQTI